MAQAEATVGELDASDSDELIYRGSISRHREFGVLLDLIDSFTKESGHFNLRWADAEALSGDVR